MSPDVSRCHKLPGVPRPLRAAGTTPNRGPRLLPAGFGVRRRRPSPWAPRRANLRVFFAPARTLGFLLGRFRACPSLQNG